MKKNESELFSGCSFLCYLTTTSSFFQKQINKICKASMVFLLQKQKSEQKKSQIILSKLESILPAIVVPSSWEKQNRDGVEILLTAVIFSTWSSKKQGKWYHNILSNSAKSKGLTIKSYLPTIKKILSSTRKSQFMKRKSLPLSTLSSQFWISRKQEFKWHYDTFLNSLPYQPSPLYQVCHYQLSQSASLKKNGRGKYMGS